MNALLAPVRMSRRAQAAAMLEVLPDDLSSAEVVIEFPDGALPTTSFVDEIVQTVLVDRRAAVLRLVGGGELTRELAEDAANFAGVRDRLVLSVT